MAFKEIESTPIKKMGKQHRQRDVLFGLVEYFIQTGKPVGSNSLKEAGFKHLSSATIRNYFAHLEKEGLLIQAHSSGGRIPTHRAFRLYAEHYLNDSLLQLDENPFESLFRFDSREIALFLQEAADLLSQETQCAVFLSSPRFDHDVVIDIKLVALDNRRCLCILVTEFGLVQTEILRFEEELSSFSVKRLESYFHWRLTQMGQKPENLTQSEEEAAKKAYHELMLRYIVGYSTFIDQDVNRTGFSHLLNCAEFQDVRILAGVLSLLENKPSLRLFLKETIEREGIKFWIGSDLDKQMQPFNCSVITIPYAIHRSSVGAVGILGPARLPYRKLFALLRKFSDCISEVLTRNIYKFKIAFRQPEVGKIYLEKEEGKLIQQAAPMLLEDKAESSSER